MPAASRLALALVVCVAATVAELIGGWATHSVALTADGLHSLIHVGALGLALAAALAKWPEAGGIRRAASAVNASVIALLALILAVESARRMGSGPGSVDYDGALAVTALGIAANIATIAALGGGSPEDINHRAALWHLIGDGAVGGIALVGLGLGRATGWNYADPAAGLVGAGVLFVISARLLARIVSRVSAAPSAHS